MSLIVDINRYLKSLRTLSYYKYFRKFHFKWYLLRVNNILEIFCLHFTFQVLDSVGKLKDTKAEEIKTESKRDSIVKTCRNVTWKKHKKT